MPVIENHGLRVVNERTYQIVPGHARPAPVWLHDMTIETSDGQPIAISPEFSHRLEASIMAVVGDRAESDGYNALILRTALGWREFRPSGRCPATCTRSAAPPGLYVGDLAQERRDHHQPGRAVPGFASTRLASTDAERSARETALLAEIEEQLKSVASLDEDRILRRFTNLVQATVRTNLADRRERTSASGDLLQVRCAPDR